MYCAAQQYLCLKFSTISVSWTPCRDLFHPPVLSRPTRTSECLRWCLSSASGLGRSELLVLCPVSASPTSCSLFSWFSSCRPADRRCCLHLEASSPWAQVLLAFFSPVYYLNLYAPCGLLGVMCPWVDFWFWLFSCLYPLFFTFPYLSLLSFIRPVRAPGHNVHLIRFLILALYILFVSLYRMLPHLSLFLIILCRCLRFVSRFLALEKFVYVCIYLF